MVILLLEEQPQPRLVTHVPPAPSSPPGRERTGPPGSACHGSALSSPPLADADTCPWGPFGQQHYPEVTLKLHVQSRAATLLAQPQGARQACGGAGSGVSMFPEGFC